MIGPIKLPIMKVNNRNSWGMMKKLVMFYRIPPESGTESHQNPWDMITRIHETWWDQLVIQHGMYIAGEELFQIHGLHRIRGVKHPPNVQVIMLGQDREILQVPVWRLTGGLKHIYTPPEYIHDYIVCIYIYENKYEHEQTYRCEHRYQTWA